jgi:hypothetical protein
MKNYTAAPYGCKVCLYTDAELFYKKTGESVFGCAGMTAWLDGNLAMYVGDNDPSTLVHECTHAVLFILGYVGIDPASSNGEPMAYLMDNMFSAFIGEI